MAVISCLKPVSLKLESWMPPGFRNLRVLQMHVIKKYFSLCPASVTFRIVPSWAYHFSFLLIIKWVSFKKKSISLKLYVYLFQTNTLWEKDVLPPRPFCLWCAREQTLSLPAAALGKMVPAPSGGSRIKLILMTRVWRAREIEPCPSSAICLPLAPVAGGKAAPEVTRAGEMSLPRPHQSQHWMPPAPPWATQ